MNNLQDVLEALKQLSAEEKRELLTYLQEETRTSLEPGQRIPGLRKHPHA